jgi:hypothetical protein
MFLKDFGYHSRNAQILLVGMVVTLAVAIVAAFLRLMPWTRVARNSGCRFLSSPSSGFSYFSMRSAGPWSTQCLGYWACTG